MKKHSIKKGFTLIELMVTIAIIAILMAIALPSFQDTIARSKLETEANNILRDLNFARTEAIKRGSSVSLCPSDNGTSCSGAQDYGDGWIIFVDDVTPDNAIVDTGEEVLRVVENPATTIDIVGTKTAIYHICYAASGMLCSP
jgi:type IV fimbrial biogenesis protein FimT